MGDVVAYHLRLLQGFLQQRRAHRSSDLPGYPPVTEETSFRIKQGLAARGNIDFGAVPAGGFVPEVAKWLVRIEGRHVKAPLFRLVLEVVSEIPSQHTYPAGGQDADFVEKLLGHKVSDETVVRASLPVPIGRRFGEIAESLLALSKRILGLLLVFDVGIGAVPFYDVSELVTQRLGTAQEPAIFTIRPADAFYVLIRSPGFQGDAPPIRHCRALVRMKHVDPFGAL